MTVLTAGVAATAFGASAAVISGVMTGAAVGGLVSGGLSIVGQCINGIDTFDFRSIMIDTFSGAAFGAITAGTAGVGTIGAKVVGGIGKILVSGLTTTLHQINMGTPANEAMQAILTSMLFSALLQSIGIGGGQFFKNFNLKTGSSAIGNFIKNVFNNTNLKITIIEGIKGIVRIINN